MATTPVGEIGALIAWSTTQRRDSPRSAEDEERVAEEDPDAAGHRAQLVEHGPMMPPVRGPVAAPGHATPGACRERSHPLPRARCLTPEGNG